MIELMNKVVNERRGAIFDETSEALSPSNASAAAAGVADSSGRSASKKVTNSLFGMRSSPNKK